MTELEGFAAFDAFDQRLGSAMRAYAAEVSTDVDARGLARLVVGGRRRGWRGLAAPLAYRSGALRWGIALALLIAATVIALVAIGSNRPEPVVSDTEPPPMPRELLGEWIGNVDDAGALVVAGEYELDFVSAGLITGPVGEPIAWAGRAMEFQRIDPQTFTLLIRAASWCGDATYTVHERQIGLRFGESNDRCAERAAILHGSQWRRPWPIQLVPGERYGSRHFSEPLHFTAPPTVEGGNDPSLQAQSRQGVLFMRGSFSFQGKFLDDVPVFVSWCEPRITLPDIPATPEAVGEWLRTMLGQRLRDPIAIEVNGRTALRFDIGEVGPCLEDTIIDDSLLNRIPKQIPPNPVDAVLLEGRVYAIPSGDDTILFVSTTWGGAWDDVAAATDALVGSITFD